MSDIRVGIVGYGWVAGAHIEALHAIQGVKVTAVCSRRSLDAAELSARHGSSIRVFSDFGEMCKQADIDVVSICTPHPFHVEQTEIAAAAGKHLILEKPVALDMDGLRRVERAVKQAGVKAQVCFEVRVVGLLQTLRETIAKGLLGDLHYGEVDYYHGIGPWYGQYAWNIKKEMGGSSLLTAGCHAMDALLWLMDSPVIEVTSYAARSSSPHFSAYEYPTTTTSIMRFANGAVGKTASLIDALQPYLFNVHLCGAQGSVWNDQFYTQALGGLDRNGWSRFHTARIDSGDVSDHPYVALFSDFIDAIRQDREPTQSFDSAMASHRAVLAADLSVERGAPVKLEELA